MPSAAGADGSGIAQARPRRQSARQLPGPRPRPHAQDPTPKTPRPRRPRGDPSMRERLSVRGSAAAALAAVALWALPVTSGLAQDWPSRPIRFIVPVVAGGSTDAAARLIG